MAIYNISDMYEKDFVETDETSGDANHPDPNQPPKKDRFFSSLAARLFFLLLLVVDVLWGIYSVARFMLTLALFTLTFGKANPIRQILARAWLSCKRAIVCAIALMVAIFSPALGIMFSCMYFLMYDKAGIEEIVPSSLQDQFKEFFPSSGG